MSFEDSGEVSPLAILALIGLVMAAVVWLVRGVMRGRPAAIIIFALIAVPAVQIAVR
ncbi:hypothetical protein CLV47_12355 [Antricoccus suffuscus]|uniref:Uncharacterized protein n=1 Tax=Antricoccus suffuscus TaxID=1629062 RepID=A0A2T0ZEQ3_9ACTN|nr:hypothetical protein [Antricoccus suffuscus]PRZ34823.1 hypothetical protein CLV47_12355 [Antricoccus suffuscus]